MPYRSTWVIRYDETQIDSSELRRQITKLYGVKSAGCTGTRKE